MVCIGYARISTVQTSSILQSWARDNMMTMFSGHKVVSYCSITIFEVATLLVSETLTFFDFFLIPKFYYVVAKLYTIVACPALLVTIVNRERHFLTHGLVWVCWQKFLHVNKLFNSFSFSEYFFWQIIQITAWFCTSFDVFLVHNRQRFN